MRESKQGLGGGPSRRSATLAVCYDVADRRRWQGKSETGPVAWQTDRVATTFQQAHDVVSTLNGS